MGCGLDALIEGVIRFVRLLQEDKEGDCWPLLTTRFDGHSESKRTMKAMNSIFLSHASGDKPFVRRLFQDLTSRGIRAWLDEAELKPGDSLISKISTAIDQMDFLGVVLSEQSVDSEWVQREVAMALNQEISGKKVKVIPLLLTDCKRPGFLLDKVYIDFRNNSEYDVNVARLCAFLTEQPFSEKEYSGTGSEYVARAKDHFCTAEGIRHVPVVFRHQDRLAL